jgi:hypothetical protein
MFFFSSDRAKRGREFCGEAGIVPGVMRIPQERGRGQNSSFIAHRLNLGREDHRTGPDRTECTIITIVTSFIRESATYWLHDIPG